MVTMVVMVTVAKAKNYCIDSKIGTQGTIIIGEPELLKTFTLAVFLHPHSSKNNSRKYI